MTSAFNSPMETGIRSVAILTSLFPRVVDLQHLVYYDYLTLHSADAGGPASLHAPLPLRSGELSVRRSLLEQGILLMLHRGLIGLTVEANGFYYRAVEGSAAFLSMLNEPYLERLLSRAEWVATTFGDSSLPELMELERSFVKQWSMHFESIDAKEIEE